MKKRAFILLFCLCVFSVGAQSSAQVGSESGKFKAVPHSVARQDSPSGGVVVSGLTATSGIDYNDVSILRSGEYVEISFGVKAGVQSIGRGEQLILTPVLYNDSVRIALPTITVQSRRAEWQEFRAGQRPASTSDYRMPNGGKIAYSAKTPYHSTLTNVLLRVDQTREVCARSLPLACVALTDSAALVPPPPYVPKPRPLVDYAFSLPITSVAEALAQEYGFVAAADDFERRSELPKNEFFNPDIPLNMGGSVAEQQQSEEEQFIATNEKGAMQIDFERNSTQISRYNKDNNMSLVTLASVLKKIERSEDSHVTKIIIAGFASPEGPLAHNDRLALGRAQAMLDFIRANSAVPQNDIQLYNGSEDWRGLRRMILGSDMEHKQKLLEIIDRVPVLKGREKQLMDVAGGDPYRYMAQHFFPKLRNAAYIKVYYDTPPAVAALAQDLAQAWERMHSGDYAGAMELLNTQTPLPGGEVENLIGVCYIMLRDYDRARDYLHQAIAKGNIDAQKNLEQLDGDVPPQDNLTHISPQ